MGSRGSVIPLFVNQIKENKPITITNPKMTRFMMTLDDAVDLVIHAFKEASQGDIFVQKAPACNLINLVKALKKIFLYSKPDKIMGTRHGEKLYESLISKEEMARSIEEGKFFRIPPDNRDLNYEKFFNLGNIEIEKYEDYTSHNTEQLKIDEIVQLLLNVEAVKDAING